LFFPNPTWGFFLWFVKKLQKLLIYYGFGFGFFKATMAWKKQYGYYIERTYVIDASLKMQ